MLTRSFLPAPQRSKMLAYSPMMHARLYDESAKYRETMFQPTRTCAETGRAVPYLDGNPELDRPLIVQFCANSPSSLLEAARRVAPYCDAVDLNLGCPQGIAKRGRYGAFLQEDQELVFRLVNTLHRELSVPVTAKIRILDSLEETLGYARNVLDAGASILSVHGRRREQKGHLTGLADWEVIRWLRERLGGEVVLFANGNVLGYGDVEECLVATGADGVMSAEGNLSNPAIFLPPLERPVDGGVNREYWWGRDGRGGWRVDAVFRRYMDLLHRYAKGVEPPERRPLFVVGDDVSWLEESAADADDDEPARKKAKGETKHVTDPNLVAMKAHMFTTLRHFVSKHTDVRDALSKARLSVDAYEEILQMVERRVAQGLVAYDAAEGDGKEFLAVQKNAPPDVDDDAEGGNVRDPESSAAAVRKYRMPWWVCQPIIRPSPGEALRLGRVKLSKKDLEAAKRGGKGAKRKRSPGVEGTAKVEKPQVEKGDPGLAKNDTLLAG